MFDPSSLFFMNDTLEEMYSFYLQLTHLQKESNELGIKSLIKNQLYKSQLTIETTLEHSITMYSNLEKVIVPTIGFLSVFTMDGGKMECLRLTQQLFTIGSLMRFQPINDFKIVFITGFTKDPNVYQKMLEEQHLDCIDLLIHTSPTKNTSIHLKSIPTIQMELTSAISTTFNNELIKLQQQLTKEYKGCSVKIVGTSPVILWIQHPQLDTLEHIIKDITQLISLYPEVTRTNVIYYTDSTCNSNGILENQYKLYMEQFNEDVVLSTHRTDLKSILINDLGSTFPLFNATFGMGDIKQIRIHDFQVIQHSIISLTECCRKLVDDPLFRTSVFRFRNYYGHLLK